MEADDVLDRLVAAFDDRDLEALLALFHPDYESEQPLRPELSFRGREHVRDRWSENFASMPDFRVTVLGRAAAGDTAWREWRWQGTRADGRPYDLQGVAIYRIRDGLIVSARLYMDELPAPAGS